MRRRAESRRTSEVEADPAAAFARMTSADRIMDELAPFPRMTAPRARPRLPRALDVLSRRSWERERTIDARRFRDACRRRRSPRSSATGLRRLRRHFAAPTG